MDKTSCNALLQLPNVAAIAQSLFHLDLYSQFSFVLLCFVTSFVTLHTSLLLSALSHTVTLCPVSPVTKCFCHDNVLISAIFVCINVYTESVHDYK